MQDSRHRERRDAESGAQRTGMKNTCQRQSERRPAPGGQYVRRRDPLRPGGLIELPKYKVTGLPVN